MDEADKDLLERLRLEITNVLHVEDVLDFLRVRRILTANDDEIVRGGHTRTYRCDRLLDILPTRGATAYDAFVEGLEFVTHEQKINGYRRLIKKLKRRTEETVSDSEDDSDDDVRAPRMPGTGDSHKGTEFRIVISSDGSGGATTLPRQPATQNPCATVIGTKVHVSCEQQIQDLVQQRNVARDDFSNLQHELAKFEHLEKDYNELVSMYAKEEDENRQRFVELRHALEQNYVFSRELDRLNAELGESSAEMERLRRIQAETSASEGSSFRFRDLYTEVSVERDDLKKRLCVEMATGAELTAKVDTMRHELDELKTSAQEERQVNATLREQLKQADIEVNFERHNSITWRSRLHEKEDHSCSKELSDLTHQYKQRCEDLNTALKDMKDLRTELDKVSAQLENSIKMYDEAERRYTSQSKVLQELNDKYGLVTNENRSYKTQLHLLAIELQELQSGKEELDTQCRVFKHEMVQREARAEDMEELHTRWRSDMDMLQRQVEELRQDRDKTKTSHLHELQAGDSARSKCSEIQHRLNQSEFNYNKCMSELSETKRNGFLLEYQLHQLASIVNTLLDTSEVNKTDQDRARLHLTFYRAAVAGKIPEGLQEVEIPPQRRLPIMEVALNKTDDNTFGISLESQIVVSKSQLPVVENYRDLLLPGDRILKVNGFSVTDQRVCAVEEYLQQSPPTARLLVFRSPTSFLAPVGDAAKAKMPVVTSPATGTLKRQSYIMSDSDECEEQSGPRLPSIIIQSSTLPPAIKKRETVTDIPPRFPLPIEPINVRSFSGQYDSSVLHDNDFTFSDSEVNKSPPDEDGTGATYPAPFIQSGTASFARPRSGARSAGTRERIVRRSSSMGEFDRLRRHILSSDSASDTDADGVDAGDVGDAVTSSESPASRPPVDHEAPRPVGTGCSLSKAGEKKSSIRGVQRRGRRRLTPNERKRWMERAQCRAALYVHTDYSNTFSSPRAFCQRGNRHKRSSASLDEPGMFGLSASADDVSSRGTIVLPKGSNIPPSRMNFLDFHIDIVEHRLEDPMVKPTDRRVSVRTTDSHMIPGSRIVSIPLERIRPLNIQLAGGRGNGVYIEDVLRDTTGSANGKQLNLKPGDQLLRLGNCDLGNATYEMAATAWKLIRMACSLRYQDDSRAEEERCFSISVRDQQAAYRNLLGGVRDAFFIRITRAVDREYVGGELRLETGALYHVVDTMFQDKEGQWRAHRITDAGQILDTGCIPSASVVHMATKGPVSNGSPMRKHADSQSAASRLCTGNNARPRSASAPMAGGFEIGAAVATIGGGAGVPGTEDRRKSHIPMATSAKGENGGSPSWMQRIKRELSRTLRPNQSTDDAQCPSSPKLSPAYEHPVPRLEVTHAPVYEVVEKCRLVYARPVIIIGAMAERLMHQLLHDPHSSAFVNCAATSGKEVALHHLRRGGSKMEFTDEDGHTRAVTIQSIVDLAKKQKHSVFANVSAGVVGILQSHCLYPIVIRIVVKNISQLCYCLGVEEGKAGQIIQQGNTLAAQHISITDSLVLDGQSDVKPLISELKELVSRRQNESLWIASDEQLPTHPLGHDEVRDWLQNDVLGNG